MAVEDDEESPVPARPAADRFRAKPATDMIARRVDGSRVDRAHLYPCVCCGHRTLEERPPGTFEICEVCRWQDDETQYADVNLEGGANEVSLKQARQNFKEFGASSREYLEHVRPPDD